MMSIIKKYNKVHPTHFYVIAALIAVTWLVVWPRSILSVSISTALIASYLLSILVFRLRLSNKASAILRSLTIKNQDVIHGIAANTTTKKYDETEFRSMVSKAIDYYILPENIPFYFMVGLEPKRNAKILANAGYDSIDGINKTGPFQSSIDSYHFQWWFTSKGILIDLSVTVRGNENSLLGSNLNQLDSLSEFLKQFGLNPVKGLIYTLSTDLILAQDQDLFIENIQHIKTITQKILSHTSSSLSYYILLENAQNIEGFNEFVSSCIQTGSITTIGVEFSSNQIDNHIANLINHLNSLLPGILYEKGGSYNPLLLTKFLNNIDLLRELISEIGQSLNSISKSLSFKGVYFLGENDGLISDNSPSSTFNDLDEYYQKTSRDIFDNILDNIILHSKDRRTVTYMSWVLPLVLTVGGLAEIGYLFDNNYSHINVAKTNAEAIQLLKTNTNQMDVGKLLQVLNKTKKSLARVHDVSVFDRLHSLVKFSVSEHLTQSSANIYRTILDSQLSKNISEYIKYDLNNFANLSTEKQLNFVRLLADIRNSDWKNPTAIYAYFKEHISNSSGITSKINSELKSHFDYYVANISPKNILIDNSLVRQNITALQGKRLEDYILHSVHAQDNNEHLIFLIDRIDKNFGRYLKAPEQFRIPYRYTSAGYTSFIKNLDLVLKLYEKRINSISTLGESSQINIERLKKKLLYRHISNHVRIWRNVFKPFRFSQFKSRAEAVVVLRLLARSKDITVELKLLAYKNLPQSKSQDIVGFKKFLKRVNDNPKRAMTFSALARSFTVKGGNLSSIKLLKKLRLSTQTTWIGKTYLNTISRQLKLLLQGNRKKILVDKWNKTIYSYCVKNFKNRYPFVKNYNRTVSSVRFRRYFGRKGMLDRFYKKQLKKYVVMRNRKLHWNKRGQILDLNNEILKQFETARAIKKHWLRYGKIEFNFKVKPLFLDPRANRFKLTVGRSTVKYSHGVQQYQNIGWTPDRYSASVHFTFFKPGGLTVSGTYPKNRWSWIQLIDKTVRTKKGIITFRRKGYKAQYRIGRSRRIMNKLNLVSRYRCIRQQ